MKTQHTPGPWNVGQDSTAIKASGAIIARTFHWANQYTPIEEGHANAKLIAAAPDLLAALRMVSEIWSHDQTANLHPESPLAIVRAALAKVEGI